MRSQHGTPQAEEWFWRTEMPPFVHGPRSIRQLRDCLRGRPMYATLTVWRGGARNEASAQFLCNAR